MGRTVKKGVDYFSHDVGASLNPTLYTLQVLYGNDGYAFWFKLLEHLGTKENLVLDCNNSADWHFFLAKARVSEELGFQILDKLATLGAIEPDLWENKIVWSENFAERLSEVYKKRGTERPAKPECQRNNESDDCSAIEKHNKKDKQKVKKEKMQYAEFVMLSEEEYGKLVGDYGKKATEKIIDCLNNYKGSNGKTYKSDYLAILNWVVDRVKRESPELFGNNEKTTDGNPFEEYV